MTVGELATLFDAGTRMRTNMVSPYAKYPCYRVRIVLHDRQTRDVTVLGIEIAGVLFYPQHFQLRLPSAARRISAL
jgi:hypothetical protein